MKNFKKLIVILAGVACIIIAAIVLLAPRSDKEEAGGPVVIASERVKIDLKSFDSTDGTEKTAPAPEPAPAVAEKKPEPVSKPAPVQKKPAPATRTVKKAAPQKTAPVKTAKPSPAPRGSWAINVASFTARAPALSLKDKLNRAGYHAYTTEFVKDGTRWNRVRVGFFPTRAAAEKAAKEVKSKARISQTPWVVRPPKSEISSQGG